MIKKLFAWHNLGPLPEAPFSNEVILSLTNRIKSQLMDLELDLQDKKVNLLVLSVFIPLLNV